MGTDTHTIRPMTVGEVGLAVDWAAAEGWNPGLNDAACYFAADNGGFLVGLLNGTPVTTISAMRYGDNFAFLGFYIVTPQYRGQGYGIRIWNAALERLKGRNVALDGVVAQQDNYRKSGFKLAHNNIRFQTVGGDAAAAGNVVPLSEACFDAVARYSAPFFPAPRPAFLRAWMRQDGAQAIGVIEDGDLRGYGVSRPCRTGVKIGPLFADSEEVAERLLAALRSKAPAGAPVFLDVPETNPAALALAKRHSMTCVFETARMYTASEPDIGIGRTYGITSFEIG